eukprot:gb/GECH01014194.1/.p1 GENE.gb/GECH01014194.1/~~gb/GECH01014194.1/.p1  ORF type:complete len:304 (+),score=25.50 gb/GECH01014194.1/:1-912(+)
MSALTELLNQGLNHIKHFSWDNAAIDLRKPESVIIPVGLYFIITAILSFTCRSRVEAAKCDVKRSNINADEEASLIAKSSQTNAKPKPLSMFSSPMLFITVVHNMILSISSAVMFVGMGMGLADVYLQHGFTASICSAGGHYWAGGYVSFVIWVFGLSKWLEFFDTFLRVLNGKPLSFLHVWHHATVPIHMYFMVTTRWDPAVFGFAFNAFVHVVMYFYYALVALRIRVWWKQLVTLLQIFQFVVCFVILYVSLNAPECTRTANTQLALLSTNTLYLSYLVLFIHFYIKTYLLKAKAAERKEK